MARDHLVCDTGLIWIRCQEEFSKISDDVNTQLALDRFIIAAAGRNKSRKANPDDIQFSAIVGAIGQDVCGFWRQPMGQWSGKSHTSQSLVEAPGRKPSIRRLSICILGTIFRKTPAVFVFLPRPASLFL